MDESDEDEHGHAPTEEGPDVVAAAPGAGRLQREADAEEHREHRVELALDQPVDGEEHGLPQGGRGLRGPFCRRQHVGAEEAREVRQKNAAQRRASHCVEQWEAVALRRWMGGGARGGGDVGRHDRSLGDTRLGRARHPTSGRFDAMTGAAFGRVRRTDGVYRASG